MGHVATIAHGNTRAAASSTLTIPVTVTPGATHGLILRMAAAVSLVPYYSVISVFDSAGGTWHEDGQEQGCTIISRRSGSPLVAGHVIIIAWGSGSQSDVQVQVDEYDDIPQGMTLDNFGGAAGVGNLPQAPVTTLTPGVRIFAVIASRSNVGSDGETFAPDPAWNRVGSGEVISDPTNPSASLTMYCLDRVVSATGAYSAQGAITSGNGSNWYGHAASYPLVSAGYSYTPSGGGIAYGGGSATGAAATAQPGAVPGFDFSYQGQVLPVATVGEAKNFDTSYQGAVFPLVFPGASLGATSYQGDGGIGYGGAATTFIHIPLYTYAALFGGIAFGGAAIAGTPQHNYVPMDGGIGFGGAVATVRPVTRYSYTPTSGGIGYGGAVVALHPHSNAYTPSSGSIAYGGAATTSKAHPLVYVPSTGGLAYGGGTTGPATARRSFEIQMHMVLAHRYQREIPLSVVLGHTLSREIPLTAVLFQTILGKREIPLTAVLGTQTSGSREIPLTMVLQAETTGSREIPLTMLSQQTLSAGREIPLSVVLRATGKVVIPITAVMTSRIKIPLRVVVPRSSFRWIPLSAALARTRKRTIPLSAVTGIQNAQRTIPLSMLTGIEGVREIPLTAVVGMVLTSHRTVPLTAVLQSHNSRRIPMHMLLGGPSNRWIITNPTTGATASNRGTPTVIVRDTPTVEIGAR